MRDRFYKNHLTVAKNQKQIPDDCFEYQGKVYKINVHAAIIPGLGRRTKGEISIDAEAQKYLVEEKSSIIQEIA
jgi:hypothetical protein